MGIIVESYLVTIRTPSLQHDPDDPRYPHEIVEWIMFESSAGALAYLAAELAFDNHGQVVTIEALYPDDPRNFIDWPAVRACHAAT